MPVRHLLVMPLPNGVVAGKGRLSVYLAPRLREAGVLTDYSDFADWGTFVTGGPGLQFTVLIDNVAVPANQVTVTSPPVNPAVWRAVFGQPPAGVPVAPFAFVDARNCSLTSLDVAALEDQIEAVVEAYALAGADGLTKSEAAGIPGGLTAQMVAEAETYFGSIGNGEDGSEPTYEFHQSLRQLAAHPDLLRRLGLVYDLEVTLPATPGQVQVTTNWASRSGAQPRDEVPLRTRLDPGFVAQVLRPDDRVGAWLTLTSPSYAIGQLDVAAVSEQAANLTAALGDGSITGSTPVAMPAMSDGGISLVHVDLEQVLIDTFQRQREIEDDIDRYILGQLAQPPRLYAEDVTAGYRIDVEDVEAPGFQSLHRRAGRQYGFSRAGALSITPPPDENWASIGLSTDGTPVTTIETTQVRYSDNSVTKVEREDTTSWRVPYALTTWEGWSLAVSKPSMSTTGSGEIVNASSSKAPPASPVQVEVNYGLIPGTLPRLRYSNTYRLRARCVDLAGNGPALADTPPVGAISAPVQFGRLAPIQPPITVRRQSKPVPGVGDLTNAMVIKSELGQVLSTVEPTDRYLFPSSITQSRLERHNLPNGGNDTASYNQIVARDALSLADQCLIDPLTGEPIAGAAIVDDVVTPGPVRPSVDYMAEPVAVGAALTPLPQGNPDVPVVLPFGTFPDFDAAIVELRGGTGAPRVDAVENKVIVELPQGVIHDVRVSNAADPTMVDHIKAYQLLTPEQRTVLAAEMANGQNPVLSPSGTLRLVHAVRVPLSPPSFSTMSYERTEVGQTDVSLTVPLGLHRATTSNVLLEGTWTDVIDDPEQSGATNVTTERIVADIRIPVSGPPSLHVANDVDLELFDTKRRSITFRATSFCRFSSYFTEEIELTWPASGTLVIDARGISTPSLEVIDRVTSRRYARDVDFTLDPATGRITDVPGGQLVTGALLRVRFIPLPVSRRSAESQFVTGRFGTLDIASSAPPLTPEVRSVLPAFSRTVRTRAREIQIVHDGRVVRLLLERPWFSSGPDERLAVVLDRSSVLEPEFTTWARDPLSIGTGATKSPTMAAFGLATETHNNLGGRLDVAAHAVTFDAERDAWVADVLVKAAFGYRPWVNLHVARYQPNSIEGAHLSGVVATDAVRLGARRVVTVQARSGREVRVRVTGPDNVNSMSVTLQQADTRIEDPLMRWSDVSTTRLTRGGTRPASVHSGNISIPRSSSPRRLVIDDDEPVTVERGSRLRSADLLAYREVVNLPRDW